MKNKKTDLLHLSLYFLSTLLIIPLFSCSKDDDTPPPYVNIKNDKDIIVYGGESFELTIGTNIFSNSFLIGEYQIVWGNDTVKIENTKGNSDNLTLTLLSKYSSVNKEDSYPITIVNKASKQVLATGPKLKVIRTYKYNNASYYGGFSSPLLSMCLDSNGQIITISGYSFSEIRKRTYKYLGFFPEITSVQFEATTASLPVPPDIEEYKVSDMASTNSVYPNLDRNGTAIHGNNMYFNQRYERKQPYDTFHAIIKYDGVTSDIYREGQTNGAFKHPVSNIVINSKGTLFAVEYSIPGVYELNKEKGKGIWVGSPTEKGSKDGQGLIAKFSDILDMKIDKNDNIYVVEKTKIRKITPNGDVSTLIGTDEAADIDGNMKTTRFTDIQAIAFDKANKLYITGTKSKSKQLFVKIIDMETNSIKDLYIANAITNTSTHQNDIAILDNGFIALGFHAYNQFNRAYEMGIILPIDLNE